MGSDHWLRWRTEYGPSPRLHAARYAVRVADRRIGGIQRHGPESSQAAPRRVSRLQRIESHRGGAKCFRKIHMAVLMDTMRASLARLRYPIRRVRLFAAVLARTNPVRPPAAGGYAPKAPLVLNFARLNRGPAPASI